MTKSFRQHKTAVGFLVDGLHLKYVELSLAAGRVTLQNFKTVPLASKLEDQATTASPDVIPADAPDLAGFATAEANEVASPETSTSEITPNAAVLLGLIDSLPANEFSVAIALSEPTVRYHEFDSDFGLRGLKLKKKLVEELAHTGAEPPSLDALGVIVTSTGKLLSIVRQGGLQLCDLLSEIQTFVNGRTPRIKLIHSADLALMEIVRSSYDFLEKEVSALVYVGHEFSRIVFMQGNNYLHFAPIISEGHSSPDLENTISSRIRLAQENIAVLRIDRFLLAGESHKVNLLETITQQFPNARVESLQAPEIRWIHSSEQSSQIVSEYAIPISVAWHALQPKLRGTYDVDLLPSSIIENQKAFAWHGWLTAAMMVLSIAYFSLSMVPRSAKIQLARERLAQNQSKLAEMQMHKSRKGLLNGEIEKYEKAMKLYNTISQGSGRWTRILDFLSKAIGDLNSIWIQGIRPVDGNPTAFDISGRSYHLSRISALVNLFEKASLLQLRTVADRNRDVYEFDMRVEKLSKDDIPYVPPQSAKR